MFQGKIRIENGKIAELNKFDGHLEIITDNGSTIFDGWAIKGFIDNHGHLSSLGAKLNGLDLSDCKSMEECTEKSFSHTFHGSWIVGRGWNQENFINKQFPDKKILDSFFPDIPVYLTRIDGHCAWVNSKALEIAGINSFTLNPMGGEIIRNKSGEPTGILVDNAMELVFKHIPKISDEELAADLISACSNLASFGITECCEMETDLQMFRVLKKLDEADLLPIKVNSFLSAQNTNWKLFCEKPHSGNYYHAIGLKFFADGALGSRGAALIKPYSDKPDTEGLLLISENVLIQKASEGIENGFHIATHSIGDASASMVISAYKKLRDIYPDSILRIEHLQLAKPEDLDLMAKYKLIASVQPVHCISDAAGMVQSRLGGRCEYAYPWNSLINRGIVMLAGSDFPIESHNPLLGIDAFMRRIPVGSHERWYENECINLEQAIKSYSIYPKKVIYETNSDELQIGDDADLTILNKNLFTCKPDEIKSINVISTYCGGRRVY